MSVDCVIDARGFDYAWFTKCLDPSCLPDGMTMTTFEELVRAKVRLDDHGGDAKTVLDESLAFVYEGFPPNLHLPMFGSLVHPASANLMALGSVTDAILSKYR